MPWQAVSWSSWSGFCAGFEAGPIPRWEWCRPTAWASDWSCWDCPSGSMIASMMPFGTINGSGPAMRCVWKSGREHRGRRFLLHRHHSHRSRCLERLLTRPRRLAWRMTGPDEEPARVGRDAHPQIHLASLSRAIGGFSARSPAPSRARVLLGLVELPELAVDDAEVVVECGGLRVVRQAAPIDVQRLLEAAQLLEREAQVEKRPQVARLDGDGGGEQRDGLLVALQLQVVEAQVVEGGGVGRVSLECVGPEGLGVAPVLHLALGRDPPDGQQHQQAGRWRRASARR